MFDFRPYVSVEEAANYQYQLDVRTSLNSSQSSSSLRLTRLCCFLLCLQVDGNAWSARYKRLLSSGRFVTLLLYHHRPF